MEVKKRLARTITADFYGEEAAQSADENWARMFQQKRPQKIGRGSITFADVAGQKHIAADSSVKAAGASGLAASGAEANRKIAEKAVKLDGEPAAAAIISVQPCPPHRRSPRQASQVV